MAARPAATFYLIHGPKVTLKYQIRISQKLTDSEKITAISNNISPHSGQKGFWPSGAPELIYRESKISIEMQYKELVIGHFMALGLCDQIQI